MTVTDPLSGAVRSDEAPEAPPARRGRLRALAIVGVLVAGTAILLGWLASNESRGYLDPDGIDRTGGRALVRLLEGQGVQVEPARRTDEVLESAGPGTTVLVTVPALLDQDQADRLLGSGADLVLVAPGGAVVLFLPETTVDDADYRVLAPRCELAVADRSGSARVGGSTYDVRPTNAGGAAVECYPVGGAPSLVRVDIAGRTLTLLGSPLPLTNEYLDEDGNAALALGLLGEHPDLIWYRPVLETLPGDGESLTSQLPGWVGPAVLQLFVAAALAAVWRARRLGPLVREPLPVAVPAAEAVRGRARLYRRGRSPEHAAAVLRAATLARLRNALSLPVATSATAGISAPVGSAPTAGWADDIIAVAARRTGRSTADLAELLTGPAPEGEAALVRLARDLDTLETEVRRP